MATLKTSEQPIKSEFLGRVSEIPSVTTAKEYGTAMYNQLKGLNWFTGAALTAAETTALYLAVTAKPLLEKVQPQAQAIDTLACKGLTSVEEMAPFLMKPPEELVEEARKLAASTVDMGYQKAEEARHLAAATVEMGYQKAEEARKLAAAAVEIGYKKAEGIKTYSTETLETVRTYGVDKVNQALNGTETFVDKFLPPAYGEGSQEANSESSSIQERATKLTSKIGMRLYGHGFKHMMPIHTLAEESVAKLTFTVNLITQFKQNLANKSFQEHVDEAKVKASWIWEELNKEPSDNTEGEKSLEVRALSFARRTTSVLVHAYNVTTLPLASLPTTYQDTIRTASRYATELFTQLDQATNAGEITVNWLQTVRQRVASLEEIIQSLKTQEIEMESLEGSEHSDVKKK